ncbi:hypothetical protein ACH5RR_010081 [Cinchona calisaya]|uniref:RNase H type-1 domain-containing protein n=1 Tax=Cinchona calisaya TaxID=153742 RepID=A0ABD3AG71_9GENT
MQEWNEYNEATKEEKSNPENNINNPPPQIRWNPPTDAEIIINTDAATCNSTNKTGLGIVARNKQGHLLAIWAIPIQQCLKVEIAEAQALRLAMIRAKEE